MKVLRQHLEILFSRIQPEALIKNLEYDRLKKRGIRSDEPYPRIKVSGPDFMAYRHFSGDIFPNLTWEEVEMRYRNLEEIINDENVFSVLPKYTCKILRESGVGLECRFEKLMDWRSCYLVLGQDLLTVSHLAYKNAIENKRTSFFGWSALINTDNRRLHGIISRGIAENHFHLGGSSRIFELSWICLMNHPKHIEKFFSDSGIRNEKSINERFEENLSSSVLLGQSDNCLSWKERIMLACWLRAELFLIIQEIKAGNYDGSTEILKEFFAYYNKLHYSGMRELDELAETARYIYGEGGMFEQPGGHMKCLDYAITSDVKRHMPKNCCCRSLAGERAFMYDALRIIYSREIPSRYFDDFVGLFYLYILLKTRFRGEIIQVNGKLGFKNFAKYQDRKDIIFENFSEYALEALNLSVNDPVKNGFVSSLEARIAPKYDPVEQCGKIKKTDDEMRFLNGARAVYEEDRLKNEGMQDRLFYVIHFIKNIESPSEKKEKSPFYMSPPRNADVRSETKKATYSIAKAIEKNDWLCTRIRGIDACNFEIGCRSDVFAASFRFLRSFVPDNTEREWRNRVKLLPRISVSYHVGEDFIDIIDGLRAIDEAVNFLEMESGDRLGHAIAMGVDPCGYYHKKNRHIMMSKQNRLDDIVWLLNKSTQLGVSIDGILANRLRDEAEKLIENIYGKRYSLRSYYESWKLRGDDPEFYRFGRFDEDKYEDNKVYRKNSIAYQYDRCRIMRWYSRETYDDCRKNNSAAELYGRYHFDYEAKKKGSAVTAVDITDAYITAVSDMQKKMKKETADKHIGIECNPSSNMLIGPFDTYDRIPLFNFFPIEPESGEAVQFASINTDDQGVFDTSLSMEYSLVASVLCQNPNCNEEKIYDYIKKLRENGFSQIFPQISDDYIDTQDAEN